MTNEMDAVALRAFRPEERRGINVGVELIERRAAPNSLYEDEGLLIKSKTKRR